MSCLSACGLRNRGTARSRAQLSSSVSSRSNEGSSPELIAIGPRNRSSASSRPSSRSLRSPGRSINAATEETTSPSPRTGPLPPQVPAADSAGTSSPRWSDIPGPSAGCVSPGSQRGNREDSPGTSARSISAALLSSPGVIVKDTSALSANTEAETGDNVAFCFQNFQSSGTGLSPHAGLSSATGALSSSLSPRLPGPPSGRSVRQERPNPRHRNQTVPRTHPEPVPEHSSSYRPPAPAPNQAAGARFFYGIESRRQNEHAFAADAEHSDQGTTENIDETFADMDRAIAHDKQQRRRRAGGGAGGDSSESSSRHH